MKLSDSIKISVCDSSMLPKQILNELKCFLIIKGSVEIKLNDVVYDLKSDDILVVNHEELFTIRESSANIVLMLSISKEYLKNECGNAAYQNFDCNSTCKNPDMEKKYFEIKRILTRLLLVLCKKDISYELEVRSLFFQFLYYLTVHFKKDSANGISVGEENETISTLLLYINKNYYKSISLEKITKLSSFSLQYLSKFFKQKAGVGFFEYLTSVRLEHAVNELTHTDDSILKIAMNNGFANSKSFTRAFQKRYNQTPSNYRKANQINQTSPNMTGAYIFDAEIEEENLMAFLKYVNKYDQEDGKLEERTERIQISMKNGEPKTYDKFEKIINLGILEGSLKIETIEQLQKMQNELEFQYVYFETFTKREYLIERLDKHFDLEFYTHYDNIRCFEKLGLYPFIEIDFSKLKPCTRDENKIHFFMEYFHRWLEFFSHTVSYDYMKHWRIVFSYSQKEHLEEFLDFFISLYESMEHISLGIRLLPEDCLNGSIYSWILVYLKEKNCIPHFLTFHAVPVKDIVLGTEIVHYQKMAAETIHEAIRQAGCTIDDLYLTHWNTLAGEADAEKGAFFRSALIVDVIESLRGMVKGIGFYLNTFDKSPENENPDVSILALFLYFQVKRPVYFIVKAFNRMGSQLLFQDKGIIVTSTRKNEYVILISNPYYVDPIASLDLAYVQKQKKRMELVLDDLDPGKYQLKTFILDKGRAGIFNHWAGTGYPGFIDSDLISYLESAITPDFSISTKKIDTRYILQSEITFNGVILYVLNKMQ